MEEEHLQDYGIQEDHNKVPKWLILTYIVLPIWGFVTLYYFWNGSEGWFDPGYWQQLERAANTTYPIQDLTNRP